MPQTVVTELIVEENSAGAVNFARAMASAQLAAQQATAANDNYSRSMRTANDNAEDAAESQNRAALGLRSVAKGAADAAESLAKKAIITATVAAALSTLLGILLPIYTAYKLIKGAIDLVTDAWDLGGKKLEQYRQIAEKAAAVDLSASFFQKITRAATDAKLPVDELTASLKKLAEVSSEKLGGSDLQSRLDQLTEAGNFKGNTGTGQLSRANTTEEKFRAIVSLVDQAMAKGERLAALDLTSKFLSPAAQAALTRDDEYLHNMQAAADKIADENAGFAGGRRPRARAARPL
jgi:hypothetical protein